MPASSFFSQQDFISTMPYPEADFKPIIIAAAGVFPLFVQGPAKARRTKMAIKLINIGFGNIVSANRIISIVSPESAPIKRIIQEARDRHMLIDATYGRRTRAVIITDSDHVILSAVQPETVAHRLSNKDDDNDE